MGIQVGGGGGAASTATDIHPVCEGRLTLTSGAPVTTADVTAAATLYFTPYKGDLIGLFDGTAWSIEQFTERSIAIPATTDTNYDVFLYDNSGVLTLELTAWTNATTRATALTTQGGVYVRTGATTRRYLGSVRTTGVSGQCEDSESRRFVWNYYNRLERRLYVNDGTNFSYAVAAWQDYNNDSTNRREYVCGVVEDWWTETLKVQLTGGDGSVGCSLDGGGPGRVRDSVISAARSGIYCHSRIIGHSPVTGVSLPSCTANRVRVCDIR